MCEGMVENTARKLLARAKEIRLDAYRVDVRYYTQEEKEYWEIEVSNWNNTAGGLGRNSDLRSAALDALGDWKKLAEGAR